MKSQASRARHAKDLITKRHGTRPTLSSLACEIGVCREYLCRAFRGTYGTSVAEYVRRHHMGVAAHLIAEGGEDLSSVAAELGYDYPVFSKYFRRVAGVPPSRYSGRAQGELSS